MHAYLPAHVVMNTADQASFTTVDTAATDDCCALKSIVPALSQG